MNDYLELLINFPEGLEGDVKPEDIKHAFEDELNAISKENKLIESNIGSGADALVIVIIISGLFLLGKKINENLDAWIELSKKFKKLFSKLKKKGCLIDSNGSTLIALSKILEVEKSIKSIIEVQSIVLNSDRNQTPFLLNIPQERIDKKPNKYFIKVYFVNDELFYICTMKSNGDIKYFGKFSDDPFEFFKY